MTVWIFFILLLVQFNLIVPTHELRLPTQSILFESKSAADKEKEISEFLIRSAVLRMAGIRMGEIASERGTVDQIRAYGELMKKDHTQSLKIITEIAGKRNLVLPSEMGKSYEKQCAKLQGLTGQKFNKAYVKTMIEVHKEDIGEFKDAAKLKDKEVADFASSQLNTINHQLLRINQLRDRIW